MWDWNRNGEATIKHRYEESEYKSSEATIWEKEECIKRRKEEKKAEGGTLSYRIIFIFCIPSSRYATSSGCFPNTL